MQQKNLNWHLISAWLICGLGAIYYSYEYVLRISPSVMEMPLREHFGLSAAGFGLLSSVYYWAYVPMQLPVGILLDRYGPRLLLTFACFICVLGTFMFAGTQVFWIALMGRLMVGFGSAFAFVGVLKLATLWLPEDKLGMVSGLTSALGTIGAMMGDNLLGLLVIHLGWIDTIYYTAYTGVFLVFLLWFFLRDKDHSNLSHTGTIHSFKKSIVDLLIIMRNRQIWINGLFGCLVYLPTTVFAELWGIPYLKQAYGMTQQAANFANSLLFLGFTLGAPLMGFISDTLRRRKPPMFFGAIGAACIMLIILYTPDLSDLSINILMFALGLFYSSQCIVFAVGRELSPNEAAATAMAMTNMLVMLGALFLQPLAGYLLDISVLARLPSENMQDLSIDALKQLSTASDYQFALSIIPLGIIIAALLTFLLKETHADAPD